LEISSAGNGSETILTALGFENDSVNIVADEILGMAIAEYIGGTRARFEYVRYGLEAKLRIRTTPVMFTLKGALREYEYKEVSLLDSLSDSLAE